MALFETPILAITEADIQGLVTNRVAEDRRLEFKELLPGDGEAERKEFLQDVTAFANQVGGVIVYGIQATSGVATSVAGFDPSQLDNAVARLENLLRDRVSPRLSTVEMRALDVGVERRALVVRIGRSWALPHAVVSSGRFGFWTRNSNGKHAMDVSDLRTAFLSGDVLERRLRQFVDERLQLLQQSGRPRVKNPCLALHILPFSMLDRSAAVNLRAFEDQFCKLRHPFGFAQDRRYVLDGFRVYAPYGDSRSTVSGDALLFRSGAIESLWGDIGATRDDGTTFIPGQVFETKLQTSIKEYFAFNSVVGIPTPAAVFLSLVAVEGIPILGPPTFPSMSSPIDRALVTIEALVERWETDLDAFVTPLVDQIWNASGLAASPYRGPDGKLLLRPS